MALIPLCCARPTRTLWPGKLNKKYNTLRRDGF